MIIPKLFEMYLNQNKNMYRLFVNLSGEVLAVIINIISTGWKVEKVFS